MKALGPKHERETIITFNDAENYAEVWTASKVVYNKLTAGGFEQIEEGERHGVFKLLKSQVKFRKSRPVSEARRLLGARLGRLRSKSKVKYIDSELEQPFLKGMDVPMSEKRVAYDLLREAKDVLFQKKGVEDEAESTTLAGVCDTTDTETSGSRGEGC